MWSVEYCLAYSTLVFSWDGVFVLVLPGLLSCALDVFSLYVKFALWAGLDSTKDYPLPHPPSFPSSFYGLVVLTSTLALLLLKDCLLFVGLGPKAPHGPMWGPHCFMRGLALGWQGPVSIHGCPGSVECRKERRKERSREHQLWSDYPLV